MKRFAPLVAAAVLGSAGYLSAATLLMDEGYTDIRTWPGWVVASKDTTVAATGTASIKATTVGLLEPYIRFVVGTDSSIPAAEFDPAVATLSFKYKLESVATLPISMSFQWGAWGNPLVLGSTTLTGDGTWRDATINFAGGWLEAPSGTAQLTHLRIEKEASQFWGPTEMTLNLDTFTYAVPEPTSLALLGVGSLLVLRRRK